MRGAPRDHVELRVIRVILYSCMIIAYICEYKFLSRTPAVRSFNGSKLTLFTHISHIRTLAGKANRSLSLCTIEAEYYCRLPWLALILSGVACEHFWFEPSAVFNDGWSILSFRAVFPPHVQCNEPMDGFGRAHSSWRSWRYGARAEYRYPDCFEVENSH